MTTHGSLSSLAERSLPDLSTALLQRIGQDNQWIILSDKIERSAQRKRPPTLIEQEQNREISKFRFQVEQTFGIKKLHFNFDRN